MYRFTLASFLIAAAFVSSAVPARAASKELFPEVVSADDLAAAYRTAAGGGEKFRILIVPGHEPGFGGADFNGAFERDFVVSLAELLRKELATDQAFQVTVARDTEAWHSALMTYFEDEAEDLEEYVEDQKKAYARLERRGKIDEITEQVAHNAAPSEVALRLYGINRWANEHGIDLVLHLHLNDETGHAPGVRGAHSGMALYVPDGIYGNARASRAIAEPIFARLSATTATSTFGFEQAGIVEDRELIAVGAYNTSEVPSLLIEYGYIYEPRITGEGARDAVFADFAYQTAQGVKDFFGSPGRPRFSSRALPATFATDILATSTATATPERAKEVYALQAALRELGYYPGTEADLATCPVSGIPGPCTTEAVKAFQRAEGFETTGTLGPRTRAILAQKLNPAPATPIASLGSCALSAELALNASDKETNGEVSRLQAILAKDPTIYPEGLVTGFYGPATDRAVKRFQVEKGIVTPASPAHGVVGPATKAALAAACT
ncbi:MAG TPA: peptidoglycan-binding protein [Candidatus Paceibacterota bacterium]|nr:peptidoglycan-binding protein [Candidatus Paceibacterota bacterium]